MKHKIFNDDQLDALREFMNISLGQATANIAELLEAFGTMHIPQIAVRDASEIKEIVNESIDKTLDYYITKQLFAGKFGGECIFLVDSESANNLGNHLYDVEKASREDISDSVMELTNIAVSSIISRLTEELDSQVQFFAPISSYVNAPAVLDFSEIIDYTKVIVVSTQIEFKDQNVNAMIYILTKDEAIDNLVKLIDSQLEELYS